MSFINLRKRLFLSLEAILASYVGVLISSMILFAWGVTLVWFLSWDLHETSVISTVIGVLVRAFLHTGLFAIAHDAMHCNLFPSNLKINHGLGQFSLWLYGLLPYQKCRDFHRLHHRHPAQIEDPDFHFSPDFHLSNVTAPLVRALQWYGKFIANYIDFKQGLVILLGVGGGAAIVAVIFHCSLVDIALFWLLPWCFSSVQLFFFGTYLPHRRVIGSNNLHCARSLYLPELLSLLTCFHFGYHWEHHAFPNIPWYQLPNVVKEDSRCAKESLPSIAAV